MDKLELLWEDIKQEYENCVFRWKAQNTINGLMYGNGGVSSWTRDFIKNMKTHEATDGTDETVVEFCFDPNYLSMHNVYSTTYPNGSEKHAWRAGFREGVKMCLINGRKPSLSEFHYEVHAKNYDKLCVWHSVGQDAEFGSPRHQCSSVGPTHALVEDTSANTARARDFPRRKATMLGCGPSRDLINRGCVSALSPTRFEITRVPHQMLTASWPK